MLSLDRDSTDNRQLLRDRHTALWACKDALGRDTLALFNLADEKRTVSVDLTPYGFSKDYQTRELWTKAEGTVAGGVLSAALDAHDCLLVRLL